jgi:hypothetical protein
VPARTGRGRGAWSQRTITRRNVRQVPLVDWSSVFALSMSIKHTAQLNKFNISNNHNQPGDMHPAPTHPNKQLHSTPCHLPRLFQWKTTVRARKQVRVPVSVVA